jgi:hypothetical protein
MKRIVVAALMAGLALAGGTGASNAGSTSGCAVATVGVVVQPSCTYRAAGPGTYVVASISGWQIDITHADGSTTQIRSVHPGCNLPPYVPAVQYGGIPSVAGDLVKLSIAMACFGAQNVPGQRYQAGVIVGTELLN